MYEHPWKVLDDSLTEEQRLAARASGSSVVVRACAGAGKTRVIAARMAHLLGTGVMPSRIACVTFTRSAAEEIRERVAVVSGEVAREICVDTLHGIALRVLRTPGSDGDSIWTAMDLSACDDAEWLAAVHGCCRGAQRRAGMTASDGLEAIRMVRRVQEDGWTREALACRAMGVALDRLMWRGLRPLWCIVPDALACLARPFAKAPFSDVLLDEAQDVSREEAKLVSLLAHDVFQVGDPAQAIYGWRLPLQEMPVATHVLTRSFRCSQAVVDLTEHETGETMTPSVVGGTAERCLRSEFAAYGKDWLRRQRGTVAVLCRTHLDVIVASTVLGLPVKQREHASALGTIRDAVRCVTEPRDMRVAQRLATRIGWSRTDGLSTLPNAYESAWDALRVSGASIPACPLDVIDLVDPKAEVLPRSGRASEMGLARVLEALAMLRPEAADERGCVARTIHSAKGLEWDSVCVLDWPDRRAEEQAVRHVAITRARRSILWVEAP